MSDHRDVAGSDAQLWLASASPRRAALLEQLGLRFRQSPVAVDEMAQPGEAGHEYVLRVTLAKHATATRAIGERGDAPALPVLAADTAVVIDDEPLGKPADREHALAMLARLSGRCHEVLTGVAIGMPGGGGPVETILSRTRVWWRGTTLAERERYWASGEPDGKAGAYGIQGRAAVFVERIEGSYSGVVGLPLYETARLLQSVGVNVV